MYNRVVQEHLAYQFSTLKLYFDQSHILAHSRFLVNVSFLLSYVFRKLNWHFQATSKQPNVMKEKDNAPQTFFLTGS